MVTLDEIAPNYVRGKDRWPEAPTLTSHYEAVVSAYAGNDYGLVETVKSFIECVCLTILGEFGKSTTTSDPTTTQMLVETLRVLGLENTRGASKLSKVLSAHNKLADALHEMRNDNGPVAHGRDGFLDSLTSNHTRAFLLTGDTILCLLLSALEGKDPDLQFTREPYERFSHLHERIDSSVLIGLSVDDEGDLPMIVLTLERASLSKEKKEGLVELRVEPSRMLYSIDRTAYIEVLAASRPESSQVVEVIEEPHIATEPLPVTQDISSTIKLMPLYDGILSSLKGELQLYLDSLELTPTMPKVGDAQLIDSLLATAERSMGVDWMYREALLAGMKVAFRKVLIQFGLAREKAESCAENLVLWFKNQTVGIPNDESKTGDEQ